MANPLFPKKLTSTDPTKEPQKPQTLEQTTYPEVILSVVAHPIPRRDVQLLVVVKQWPPVSIAAWRNSFSLTGGLEPGGLTVHEGPPTKPGVQIPKPPIQTIGYLSKSRL